MSLFKKKKTPIDHLKQAYKQAPWRVQLQAIGFYLLPIAAIALITVIYLNISAQAATAGLQIRRLRITEEELQRSIADKRTHLAWLTSFTTTKQRAETLGYSQIDLAYVNYMTIPGYPGRDVTLLASPAGSVSSLKAYAEPRFQESLWDWFATNFLNTETGRQGGMQ
jgi:hypothetical protein